MHTPAPTRPSRPLLKWAGGKRQLIPAIGHHYPDRFDRYVEPFFGSGAVFFDLLAAGRLQGKAVRLADVNPDLIGCYRDAARRRRGRGAGPVAARNASTARDGDACYYDVRDRRFNPRRAAQASGGAKEREALAESYSPALAAMLIFLNRTGFNGLFRLNRSGAFNVPAGRYADPRICDAGHLRAVADGVPRSGRRDRVGGFERRWTTPGPATSSIAIRRTRR